MMNYYWLYGLPHELRSGYLGNSWMCEKNNPNCVPLRLTAQGCLRSLQLLRKWKVLTICDRSYAAWFSRGRSESKVMARQTSRSARGKSFAPNEPFEEYFYNVDEKTDYILRSTCMKKLFPPSTLRSSSGDNF